MLTSPPAGAQGPLRLAAAVLLVGVLAVWLVKPIGNPCPDLDRLPQGSSAKSSPSFSPPLTRTCTYTATAGVHAQSTYVPWLDWIVIVLLGCLAGGAARMASPGGRRSRPSRAERAPQALRLPREERAPQAARPPREERAPRAPRPAREERAPQAQRPARAGRVPPAAGTERQHPEPPAGIADTEPAPPARPAARRDGAERDPAERERARRERAERDRSRRDR